MKRYYFLIGCLAWNLAGAWAQDPSPTDLPVEAPSPSTAIDDAPATPSPAGDIVELIGSRQNVEQIKEQIIQSQLQALQNSGIEPADDEPTRAFVRQLDDFLSQHITWQELKPEYIELYNSTFTPEELEGMLNFYRSPLGQKILKEWPNVLQKTSAILYSRAEVLSPDVKKMTQEYLGSMRAQTAEPSGAAETVKSSSSEISEEKPAIPDLQELNLE